MDSSKSIFKSEFNWDSSCLLDIPLIDNQHQRFFHLFDTLSELISKNEFGNHLWEIVDELEKYTHYHFTTEENLLVEAHIAESEIKLHQSQHQIFIQKVEEFRMALRYNNVVLPEQMIQFMRKWFLMHIKVTDAKNAVEIKSYLKGKSA